MAKPIQIRMGGYGPPTTGFSRVAEIHRRPPGEAVRRPHRRQVCLEHHGFRLQGRGNPVAGRERHAHARLPVVELSHRPRAGAELRRSAVPVPRQRSRARRDGRRARRIPRRKIEERGRTTASSAGTRTASATSPTACARSARRPTSRACASACCRARSRSAPSNCSARAADHGPHRSDRMIKAGTHRRAGKPADQHGHLRRAQVSPLPHPQQSFLHFAADLPAPPAFDCWPADLQEAMRRGGHGFGRLPARPRGRGRRDVAARDRRAGLRIHRAGGCRQGCVRGRGAAALSETATAHGADMGACSAPIAPFLSSARTATAPTIKTYGECGAASRQRLPDSRRCRPGG